MSNPFIKALAWEARCWRLPGWRKAHPAGNGGQRSGKGSDPKTGERNLWVREGNRHLERKQRKNRCDLASRVLGLLPLIAKGVENAFLKVEGKEVILKGEVATEERKASLIKEAQAVAGPR